uniref:Putative secreted peptide n=1 Tax=Anopheles braziliensis TaxID=58242 RepID=A0A2M3ZTC5_9DIPT
MPLPPFFLSLYLSSFWCLIVHSNVTHGGGKREADKGNTETATGSPHTDTDAFTQRNCTDFGCPYPAPCSPDR